ncbi:MAG: hypothetical protein GWP91_22125 [Rhodobacterales bacterium]|nr:hypothetical protein [Rhodobacterales bacterium]
MHPITAITEDSVIYHSAFGFARVTLVEEGRVALQWEMAATNLPSRVTFEVLKRVYAQCKKGGFFERALLDPGALQAQLQTDGLSVVEILLDELQGPQNDASIKEWIVGRKLMTAEACGHWWAALQPIIYEDLRFIVDAGRFSLRDAAMPDGPRARLDNPLLAPGRRLDIALQHKSEFDDEYFVSQILLAWRTGGTQVRDLAQAALRDRDPEVIIGGLLQGGPDNIDAVIHVIRRGGWAAEQVDEFTHHLLVERVLIGLESGGPLDNEGRLAATLLRWSSPGILHELSDVVTSGDGKRLLRSTFAALPPRRGEQVALELLALSLDQSDEETAQWLGGEALGFALIDHETMSDRIEEERPEVSRWYRTSYQSVSSKIAMDEYTDDSNDDSLYTAEIEFSDVVNSPVALGDLPPRSGASLLGLGLALSRALAIQHKDGVVCNVTARSAWVLSNETIEVQPVDDSPGCPRLGQEHPSEQGDLYAAGVLLLEAMLGRPWPSNLAAHRALPYLRTCIPLLPPSALAPLDAALHPNPTSRPKNALEWVAIWQAAAVAEENRVYASRNPAARMHIGYDSHIGHMKILLTQTNQDAIFVSSKGPLSMLVVCDGISTANAGSGDLASSIASHVIANLWEQALPRLSQAGPPEIREFLDRALRMANTAVCEAALRFAGGNLDGRVPMGTTAVVALVHGNYVNMAWLGDSRAYLVGSYGASLLTADENQAGERLKAWHLHFLKSWNPAGFALVGYLGHFDEMARPEALPAHHTAFSLLDGERLVISTDGVTDYIGETHPEVAHLIAECCRGDDPDEAARALVAHANHGGGGDNATCLVATLWNP